MQIGTVLIVEDHPPARHLLESFIGTLGVRTLLAANGQEALHLLETEPIDLVVTDFIMPKLDGAFLARTIRERPGLCDIPVLMVSACDDPEHRTMCAEAGASAFLAKPFRKEGLLAAVESLLARPIAPPGLFGHIQTAAC